MTLEQFLLGKPMDYVCGMVLILGGLYAIFVEPKVVRKKLARKEPFVTDKNLPLMARIGKILIACGIGMLICAALS